MNSEHLTLNNEGQNLDNKKVVISVNGLSKTYPAATTPAVDGISFEVTQGEFFCLLGQNGAGKSTTINIICTLLHKCSGEVSIAGYTLGKDDFAIKHNIGVVFQSGVLDDVLTVKENLESRADFYGLSKAQAKVRIDELVERLKMQDFFKKRYGKLSGGQKRKCDIARALLISPKILFLDEPTTGLDPQSRIDLWRVIDDLRKRDKMTVFLTTHYMEETDDADRVAIMDKGRILVLDTPQKLKSEYSTNILIVVPKVGKAETVESLIGEHVSRSKNACLQGYFCDADTKPQAWSKISDSYHIKIPNNIDAIDLLEKLKPHLESFEMKKGDMDGVFLSVVGRKAL